MRRDEVLALTWSMVDVRHRVFRLPESKSGQKVVPIGSPVLALIEELQERRRDGCRFVLPGQGPSGRIHGSSLTRSWATFRKSVGLDDVRLHDLRHSAASDALMSGVPLAVVGKILGHKNPNTTARYAHISDAVLDQAVETMTATIVRNGKRRRTG
jgi:integrase